MRTWRIGGHAQDGLAPDPPAAQNGAEESVAREPQAKDRNSPHRARHPGGLARRAKRGAGTGRRDCRCA